ncbi:hypothetical protein GGF31_004011 [Allomyces arbusculus]|nr:hypothetical protein GGF31_004011 [Allomyces arbusculus]
MADLVLFRSLASITTQLNSLVHQSGSQAVPVPAQSHWYRDLLCGSAVPQANGIDLHAAVAGAQATVTTPLPTAPAPATDVPSWLAHLSSTVAASTTTPMSPAPSVALPNPAVPGYLQSEPTPTTVPATVKPTESMSREASVQDLLAQLNGFAHHERFVTLAAPPVPTAPTPWTPYALTTVPAAVHAQYYHQQLAAMQMQLQTHEMHFPPQRLTYRPFPKVRFRAHMYPKGQRPTKPQWFDRLSHALRDVGTPSDLDYDADANVLHFTLPASHDVVSATMATSGIIIGQLYFKFEPVDPADMPPAEVLPREPRACYALFNIPLRAAFNELFQLMKASGVFADLDLHSRVSPRNNTSYGFITLLRRSQFAAERLDGVYVQGRPIKVVRIEDPEHFFSSPQHVVDLVDRMAHEVD